MPAVTLTSTHRSTHAPLRREKGAYLDARSGYTRMQRAESHWLCLFCRPSKEQLVVSTTTYIGPDQLLCPGLFVCLPRESCIGACSLEQLSGNSMNDDVDDVEEEGFAHISYQCSEDQLMGANRKDSQHLKLCTGLQQVLPNLSSYKTRDGKFCNDSGFSEIICTGLLNALAPGSTALQTQNSLGDPKESASDTIQRDSQLTNDSGILLHGHQYTQQERSKLYRPPTTSRSDITLPRNLSHNLHQETDTVTHEDRDELVMAGGDHRIQDAAPTDKLVVSKQRPLDVVGFCPEDEIVMSTMSLHSPLTLASHKADRLTIDRRHSDIRIFSCNVPCD